MDYSYNNCNKIKWFILKILQYTLMWCILVYINDFLLEFHEKFDHTCYSKFYVSVESPLKLTRNISLSYILFKERRQFLM